MKLVFVISSLSSGGAERIMSRLVNALCEKYDITLIVLKDDIFYPISPKVKYVVFDDPEGRIKAMIKRLYTFRKLLKSLKPDLIISFMTEINVVTLLSSLMLFVPVIVSERADPVRPVINFFRKWKNILYYKARFVTYHHKDFVEPFHNDVIIHNAIEEVYDVKKNHKEVVQKIITIGRLDPQKDQETLIYAMVDVIKKFPHVILNIYGAGPLKNHLKNLILSLGLQNHVFLCGLTKDPLSILKEHDLFVFPSLYEGFGLAVAEAMSIGLPVIATAIKGNIVPYECVPIQDRKALSKRICDLIPNRTEREKLAKIGILEMKKYKLETMIQAWEDVILKSVKK